ncbi:hypothetical protein DXG03_001697 [Asterophora parasitica]|uniref:AAA+ ATPase domain-containing protein n=1 Tax=Asterophora parasitica TaxID=117018 RepID=A0A9P7GAK8_9AGAR|nr:hypothetical protein DXG03_001697 [Asterophora parasitica]
MEQSFRTAKQLFKTPHDPLLVEIYQESALTSKILNSFLSTVLDDTVGLAPIYGSKCTLTTLSISSESKTILVRLTNSKETAAKKPGRLSVGRAVLQRLLLSDLIKPGFQMDKLAAALFRDKGLRIKNGVDLLSIAKGSRLSPEALLFVLGGEASLHRATVLELFQQEEKAPGTDILDTALQAWAAYKAAVLKRNAKLLVKLAKINTNMIDEMHLDVLSKTIRDADRLVALKPTRQKNDVKKHFVLKKGNLGLTSTRFKTRLMRTQGSQQRIEIQTVGSHGQTRVAAKVTKVDGRAAILSLHGPLQGTLHSITTIGREPLTGAEKARWAITLQALQRTSTILENPFVQRVWLPSKKISWLDTPSSFIAIPLSFPPPRTLNTSQTNAVNTILSNMDADRITLIHGPPGTGKTTVIAAAITSIIASSDRNRTVWVSAQSNVAVKNVAEKLGDVGFFDFKLLVSKDFHFDWHEHLYHKIQRNVIRSDDFPEDVLAVERLLRGSRVILCTLSMLSHDKLSDFTRIVPPQTIIFDEASQIEVGDYFPPLERFQPTLRKLVFIGDDKQLAPYGQGDIPDLCSVFEMEHLKERAVFLDTQYRMPVPIGKFISRHVYGDRLKSEHAINAAGSCTFIDVATGREEKCGHSWINLREVDIAIRLARILHAVGKPYRIITPYDPQRSKLENALKAAKIPWEDKCFNVDSFQGNEADYIILSTVRSEKIGFMNDPRRTNVMLTRCKKGMIILTSRRFMEGVAASTLVGNMAKAWGVLPSSWVTVNPIIQGTFRPGT